MNAIRNKIRYLLGDTVKSVNDIFTYNSSAIFTLSEPNVVAITDCSRNDVSSGVTYSFSTTTNKLTVTSSLTSGDTVEISYTCYQNYSDSELTSYVQAALVHLSINNYYNFIYDSTDDEIYPTLETKEENLIALIASLLINPDNRSIRLPDLSITVPSDAPIDIKISRVLARYKKDTHGIFDIVN